MDILKIFARLLDYPSEELYSHINEINEAIRISPYLPPQLRREIISEVTKAFSGDIYDIEARYDEMFDRGRHHSLLLFEHIYGESRDRGQAMVDLLAIYSDAGFEVDSVHLPDYLPLFLEFLSTQEDEVAATWLADISHILLLLTERLRKSNAWEAILFEAMLLICDVPTENEDVKAQVAAEVDDRTLLAIDKEWEDKEIRFDEPLESDTCPATQKSFIAAQADSSCYSCQSTSTPHLTHINGGLNERPLNITDHDVTWVGNSTF